MTTGGRSIIRKKYPVIVNKKIQYSGTSNFPIKIP